MNKIKLLQKELEDTKVCLEKFIIEGDDLLIPVAIKDIAILKKEIAEEIGKNL